MNLENMEKSRENMKSQGIFSGPGIVHIHLFLVRYCQCIAQIASLALGKLLGIMEKLRDI